MVVIPDSAPVVETSKADELSANVPVPLPMLVRPVPPVLMLVALAPETLRSMVPPEIAVAPPVTVRPRLALSSAEKVLAPAMV